MSRCTICDCDSHLGYTNAFGSEQVPTKVRFRRRFEEFLCDRCYREIGDTTFDIAPSSSSSSNSTTDSSSSVEGLPPIKERELYPESRKEFETHIDELLGPSHDPNKYLGSSEEVFEGN